MKQFILSTTIAGTFFLYACKDNTKKHLMPEIESCDSAAVMYYHTPGNSRFFNMAKLTEKASISSISKDVNGAIITGKDSCITQGKLYFYGKGDAVYVVYFSRLPQCMTVSFIRTGEKYYAEMSEGVKRILDELQKHAKELPGPG